MIDGYYCADGSFIFDTPYNCKDTYLLEMIADFNEYNPEGKKGKALGKKIVKYMREHYEIHTAEQAEFMTFLPNDDSPEAPAWFYIVEEIEIIEN